MDKEEIERQKHFHIRKESLKIAIKLHNFNFINEEGKISSTELLKTADEIYDWLWPRKDDSSNPLSSELK